MSFYNKKHFDYQFKFIVIGEICVGKSSILQQFIEGNFEENPEITVGVEFGSKNIEINDQIFKLQIWDTAGFEYFLSITKIYYQCAALIVYDISRAQTFQQIKQWLLEAKQYGNQYMTFILVGNKSDIEKREVPYEQGLQLAEENEMEFIETSAKTSIGIYDVFQIIALKIKQKLDDNIIEWNDQEELQQYGIKLGNPEKNHQNNNNINGGKIKLTSQINEQQFQQQQLQEQQIYTNQKCQQNCQINNQNCGVC